MIGLILLALNLLAGPNSDIRATAGHLVVNAVVMYGFNVLV